MSDLRAGFCDWRMEDAPCDYCGTGEADLLLSTPDRLFGSPLTFRLVVCRKCGLARTNPRPTDESPAAAYRFAHETPADPPSRCRPPRGLLRWALMNYRGYPPMGRANRAPLGGPACGPRR
jgi:hypothetical protein